MSTGRPKCAARTFLDAHAESDSPAPRPPLHLSNRNVPSPGNKLPKGSPTPLSLGRNVRPSHFRPKRQNVERPVDLIATTGNFWMYTSFFNRFGPRWTVLGGAMLGGGGFFLLRPHERTQSCGEFHVTQIGQCLHSSRNTFFAVVLLCFRDHQSGGPQNIPHSVVSQHGNTMASVQLSSAMQ